jgi:hypothetical protein
VSRRGAKNIKHGKEDIMSREPREYYSARLRGELDEIAEKLDEMENDMESEGWEPESDYEELLSGTRLELAQAREKVDALDAASDAEWNNLYEEATEAAAAVGRAYERVTQLIDGLLPEEQ